MLSMAQFNMACFNSEQAAEQTLYLAARRVVDCGGLVILGTGMPSEIDKICTVLESGEAIGLDSTMLVRAGNC